MNGIFCSLETPASNAKIYDLRKNAPVTLKVLQRGWDVFWQELSTKHPTSAPSVSMCSYVGTKLVSDLCIKMVVRASTATQQSQHQAVFYNS